MNSGYSATEEQLVAVLEAHHHANATKDVALLESVFWPWGQFVGTDDTEQWTRSEYAGFLEKSKSGWDMRECLERKVRLANIVPSAPIATFFEVVRHVDYGLMRGSGVITGEGHHGWKIVHYVLSFSVPNHIVDKTNFLELLALREPPLSDDINAMCET